MKKQSPRRLQIGHLRNSVQQQLVVIETLIGFPRNLRAPMVSPTPERLDLSWAPQSLPHTSFWIHNLGNPSQHIATSIPDLCLPHVHTDASVPPQLSLNTAIRLPQTLKIGRDVHESLVNRAQTCVLSQGKQKGHQRVPLLAPFACSMWCTVPSTLSHNYVEGCLQNCLTNGTMSGLPSLMLPTSTSGDEVERTNAVDGQHNCARIVFSWCLLHSVPARVDQAF